MDKRSTGRVLKSNGNLLGEEENSPVITVFHVLSNDVLNYRTAARVLKSNGVMNIFPCLFYALSSPCTHTRKNLREVSAHFLHLNSHICFRQITNRPPLLQVPFKNALASGDQPPDPFYWLGWAEFPSIHWLLLCI